MPTVPTHAVVGIALAPAFLRSTDSYEWALAGAGLAMLPDLDVLAFTLGIPYGSPFGHRGITHSLFFAAALAWLAAIATGQLGLQTSARLWFYLFASIASHGLIDACTNGGRGIGLLIPLTAQRFFFPWRPIQVSPIGIGWFFSRDVWFVLRSELLWVWLPCGLVFTVAWLLGHRLQIGRAV